MPPELSLAVVVSNTFLNFLVSTNLQYPNNKHKTTTFQGLQCDFIDIFNTNKY